MRVQFSFPSVSFPFACYPYYQTFAFVSVYCYKYVLLRKRIKFKNKFLIVMKRFKRLDDYADPLLGTAARADTHPPIAFVNYLSTLSRDRHKYYYLYYYCLYYYYDFVSWARAAKDVHPERAETTDDRRRQQSTVREHPDFPTAPQPPSAHCFRSCLLAVTVSARSTNC